MILQLQSIQSLYYSVFTDTDDFSYLEPDFNLRNWKIQFIW